MAREDDVAWMLARIAKPHMSEHDRQRVYTAIGSGEAFSAMSLLLQVLARRRPYLTDHARWALRQWLSSYSGHEHEPQLRAAVKDIGGLQPWSPT